MRKMLLLLLLLSLAQVLSAVDEEPALVAQAASPSAFSGILADWKIYVAVILMLSVGLVALAYMVGQGFSIPELKAWAEVELSEVMTTVIIVVFIMVVLLIVEEITVGMVAGYPAMSGACTRGGLSGYCPAQVAVTYLNSYMNSAGILYEDVFKKSLEVAQEATFGSGVGISYEMFFFGSANWKNNPERLIDVETYGEVLNLLGSIIGVLQAQIFVLKFVTLRLAPAALLIGIVLRSFFLTRKLGGLLMAFGIGFLLVYPLMYALGWFTMDATVYGINRVAGGPSKTCPAVCAGSFDKIIKREGVNTCNIFAPCWEYNETMINSSQAKEEVYSMAYDICIAGFAEDEGTRTESCVSRCIEETSPVCQQDCHRSCELEGVEPPKSTEEIGACADGCQAECVGRGLSGPEEVNSCEESCKGYCSGIGLTPPLCEMGCETPGWTACMDQCRERNSCPAEPSPGWRDCVDTCEVRDWCSWDPIPEWSECYGSCRQVSCSGGDTTCVEGWECSGGCTGRECSRAALTEFCTPGCSAEAMEMSDAEKGAYCRQQADLAVSDLSAGRRVKPFGYTTAEGAYIEAGGGFLENYVEYQRCKIDPCGYPYPYHMTECAKKLPCSAVHPCPQYTAGQSKLCGLRWFDPSDPVFSQFDNESEINGCPEECRALAPTKTIKNERWVYSPEYGYEGPPVQTQDYCNILTCDKYFDDWFDECESHWGYFSCTVEPYRTDFIEFFDWCDEYKVSCPSQCMWISTSGKTDPTCPASCKAFQPIDESGNPLGAEGLQGLWENNLTNKTCMYIIPDIVFEQPEKCSECIFVAEKGLTFKPQMIVDCTALCGGINAKSTGYEDPATMTNSIEGFKGPSEIKAVGKLVVPAFLLPLLNLAVTMMFILTLSPVLGGDIDLPGMMRMMQ